MIMVDIIVDECDPKSKIHFWLLDDRKLGRHQITVKFKIFELMSFVLVYLLYLCRVVRVVNGYRTKNLMGSIDLEL